MGTQWCPADTDPDGFTHRIIARALDNRGLVRINGRGATWAVRITDVGRARLEKPLVPPDPDVSEIDQLILDVIETGGSLDVELVKDQPDYERLIPKSMHWSLKALGKKIELQSRGHLSATERGLPLSTTLTISWRSKQCECQTEWRSITRW
jgi:hypothetical protein